MKPSPSNDVRRMYEASADSYSEMMDQEINLPVYSDLLSRMRARIANAPGALIDTACGSGHMLSMYHERHDPTRSLLGIDLAPRMAAIARKRLGPNGEVLVGDMRDLSMVEPDSAVAVLNFFAIHHLDVEGLRNSLGEWYRVLRIGGQLLIAAWEGEGVIDYGAESDIVALRYTSSALTSLAEEVGFGVTRCVVDPVDGFPMDAIYLEGTKGKAIT